MGKFWACLAKMWTLFYYTSTNVSDLKELVYLFLVFVFSDAIAWLVGCFEIVIGLIRFLGKI